MVVFLICFFIFLIFPVLSMLISFFLILTQKMKKSYLLLFVCSISIIILRYSPDIGDDSSRHYFAAYMFSTYDNIMTFISTLYSGELRLEYDYQNYPLYALLLYLFSGTYTYSLISFVVCFLTYYFYLYVVVDLYQNEKINRVTYIFIFISVLVLNNYRYTTSGMRYCLIIAMLVFLFYLDSKRGMRDDKFLLLYIIPILIHPSSLLYIFLRITYFYWKKITIVKSIVVGIITPITFFFIPYIGGYANSAYGDMITNKLLSYESNDAYSGLFTLTLITRIYIGTLIGVLFILIYVYLTLNKKYFSNNVEFSILTYYICLLNIGMFPYQNIVDRNIFILLPMVVISLGILMCSIDVFHNKKSYILMLSLYIVLITMGIIYNRNFPFRLLDYSITDIVTKNIIQYFIDLPRYN